ncbi:alkaline phosphatase [Cecembia lonarensis]|uniref:Alkaline phosphatase 4 n=1 Tax=Cecembia lonarensis (strain CCUG 58316 / KCTC 22772 / LW9) TaxID=1225176 RepID=K1LF15_CECL9|nr:alkaline phosphatase [Cecembia lonarensis]EKB50732.1 Alkaline phosphatase 4 precursor [Cecembia lonarensis LW9]
MKRRDFFKNGLLTTLGLGALGASPALATTIKRKGLAKNIIFLVSDGMSSGTLNMADILMRHKYGKPSTWIDLYEKNTVKRGLMDTASANSFVTDSAAAGSAWGGGMRVRNGALNIGPNGEKPVPILQKFKSMGKAVGCVTTVQITHATPASFCVNNGSRNAMPEIAEDYLKLRFDVMLGGGANYFSPEKREDQRDLFEAYRQTGFDLVRNKAEMLNAKGDKPMMGVFADEGLPYAIDRNTDPSLSQSTPSLPEMTQKAIDIMSKNPQGFVLQVEGGKVDWAAHGNDGPALLYDQVDFDEAVKIAMAFALNNDDTLVIITTDHGNSNPGLFYSGQANKNFERLYETKASNEWILNQINPDFSLDMVRELFVEYQQIPLKTEEAEAILASYQVGADGLYNPANLPFHQLAGIQSRYTSIQWAGTNHSADYVELAMYGPGSEKMNGFVKNYELHNFMLEACGAKRELFV